MARAKKPIKKPDKYSKVQPKIHPLTYAGIIGFFVIVLGLILIFQPSPSEIIYDSYTAAPVQNSTGGFTEDHPFVEVTYKGGLFKRGLEKIIEKDEIVFLLISTPSCPVCTQHMGAFQSYFFSREMTDFVDRIYYLNPLTDAKGFETLQSTYEDIGNFTPQLIVFKNGEIVEMFEVVSNTVVSDMNRSVRDFYVDVRARLEA